ncbi:Zn(2)-C6 fungal-type domain-containing protein [Fusarium keratoplasticum]|nr:Zn(2)-C6 fungal-type domain-containing protein [Fusarium keratoplasticum]
MSSSDKQPSASDAGLKIWSCVICRRRKVRCDRRDPCSNCVKNNIECHFPVTGRIPRRNQNPGAYKSPAQKQSELLSRLRRLESVVTELAAQVEDGSQDPRAAIAPGPSGAASISSSETGPTPAGSEDPSVTESSLTTSSTSQQAGSEYDEEFGRLVVDKDGGLHVGNRFWSVFCGEVDNILQAVHDVAEYSGPSSDSIMPEPGLESGPSPLSHLGFVFGNADFAKALDGLNPMPSQMLFIWQAYVENVDPFIKVLHVPTVEKVVRELRGNFSSYGANMEALLFAISLAAITSMNEEAVSFNFNTPKSQLIQRYQFGTEQALARADFLVTKDIIVLQALVICLSLLPHLGSKEKVWPMMGLVLRLAKSAGLHLDDTRHTRSQVEMETRRRLWWQICFVDSQSRRAEAPELSITSSSFDTSIPSNLDDIDLLNGAPSHLPVSHEKPTATTLCLIRCELWRLTQSLRDDITKSPGSHIELLNLTKTKIETKYLRHLQLDRPWDSFIKNMTTLFFSKVELLIRRQPNSQHSINTSLEPVMNTVKSVHALKSTPSWAKWRWQLQGQVPWHAMGVFLRQACHQPWTPPLEETWQATQELISSTPESTKSGPMWQSLMKLSAGAQAHRERELGRQEAEAQPGNRAGDPTSFNAEAAAIIHSHDPITVSASSFQSSLHISPPDPGNPLMHQHGIGLHGTSDNPPLWTPAGDMTDFGQVQPPGDISILDDTSLMDWEALTDMDGSWAAWDLF